MGGKVKITQSLFGKFTNPSTNITQDVPAFTLENSSGMRIRIIAYGAAIQSLEMPSKSGEIADIVLGFDDMEGYRSEVNPYFGAVIGRVSNRIGKGKFTIEGVEYQVPVNNGPNSLHGGFFGFDKKLWEGKILQGRDGPYILMSLFSEDGDQGYPGNLIASVRYELTEDCNLKVDYQATVTKTCPVAMTNHSYFNLEGHSASGKGLEGHWIQLNCDRWTPVDEDLLTLGTIETVEGTVFDLRRASNVPELLRQFPEGPNGYDNNLCVVGGDSGQQKEMRFVGRLQHQPSGRVMEVHSDQPGIQFYSGNFLPDPKNNEEPVKGKGGAEYFKHGSICLETQNYPNAVNHANFPNALLQPGEVYRHSTIFKFFTVQ